MSKPRIIVALPRCPACENRYYNVTRTMTQADGSIERSATCRRCGCRFIIESIDDPELFFFPPGQICPKQHPQTVK